MKPMVKKRKALWHKHRDYVHDEVFRMVKKANRGLEPERQVPFATALEVANRALKKNRNPYSAARAFAALRAVSSFISMATSGVETIGAAENFDLLPVGHPLSTRQHGMAASALQHARARWLAADPLVDSSIRPLVAAAHAAAIGSVEREFMFERLAAMSNDLAPLWTRIDDPVTTFGPLSFIGGNSSAARRARAQLQRRDRNGRFAEMGGGWSFNLRGLDGLFSTVSGRVVGSSGDGDAIEVEVVGDPDLSNGIYTMPSSKGEAVKAILPEELVKGLPKRKAVAGDEVFMSVEELKATKKSAPTGWKFAGRIKNGAPAGDKTFYDTEDGYEVSVSPNTDGTTTFKIRRKENIEGDNFAESYSSWGDVQKAALADQDDYEKALEKAAGGAVPAEAPKPAARPELPPVEERSFRKSDAPVMFLKRGDLIPKYFPTAAGEAKLKKQRADDPNFEMPPADEVVGIGYYQGQKKGKVVLTVRDLKTGAERKFEVNEKSTIYDSRIYEPEKPKAEAPAAPEAPPAPAIEETAPTVEVAQELPEFLDEEFSALFDVPSGAYKPNIFDMYTPVGKTDQDSADYTDDPSVLVGKFTTEEIAAALRDAVIPSADGPANGLGALEFDAGDELVPAEALYEALQLSGLDADMVLGGIYDSELDADRENGTNIERLRARRESEVIGPEAQPELVPLTERGKQVEEAIKRNEAVATPTRAQRGVDLMNEYTEDNESLKSVARRLNELQDTEDFYDDEGLQRLLEEYLPWSRSENQDEREAFRGLWGLFMSLDGGASNDQPSPEELADMGFRGRVMRALDAAFPGEDFEDTYPNLLEEYGGYPEFVDGRNAIADGKADLTSPTTAAAFYRLTKEAARPTSVEVQRSIGVSPDDPLFVTYTTPGSVFALDPRSFTTNNLADAKGLEALQFAPGSNFSHVIFRVAPGDADTFSAISFSWFPGEQEHIGWGNYEVTKVRKLENPLRKDQAKVEVTIRKTDKRPSAPTEESIFEDTKLDVSDWKMYGGQAGSNKGGFFEDPDGNQYYVKVPKSQKHAENEVLAAKFYERLGVPAAEVRLGEEDGDTRIVSPLIPEAVGDLADRLDDEEYLAKLRDGFVVDAWLANWDVAGLEFDNVMTDIDGNPVRVDPGGALMYRARGAAKGPAFGDTVGELDTLRDPDLNPQNARIFGGVTDAELNEQAARLRRLEPEEIDAIVDSTITDPEMAATLKQRLRARREDILLRYPGGQDSSDVFNERTPLTTAMSRQVSELERGDIMAEDSFVIEQVFSDTDTPNGKISVQGYYPGHQSQRKEYDPEALVEASRGGTIPPKGDRDPLHKPEPPRNMDNPAEVAAYRDELAQYEMAKAVAAAWSCGGAGLTAAVGGDGPCTVPSIDSLIDKVNADPSATDPIEVPEADGIDVTGGKPAEVPAGVLDSAFADVNDGLTVILEDETVKPVTRKKVQALVDSVNVVRDRLASGELTNEEALSEINEILAGADRNNDDVDFIASSVENVRNVLDGSAFAEKLDPELPPPGAVHPKNGKPVGFAKDGVTKVVPGMLVRDKDGFAGVVDRYNKSDWVGVYIINAIDGQKYMKASNQLTPINPGDDDRAYVEPPGGYSGQAKMRTIVPDGTVETKFSGWNSKARAKHEEKFGPRAEEQEVPKAEAPGGAPEAPAQETPEPQPEEVSGNKYASYEAMPSGVKTDVDMVMDELLTAQAVLSAAYANPSVDLPSNIENPAKLMDSLIADLASGDVSLKWALARFDEVINAHETVSLTPKNVDKFQQNPNFGSGIKTKLKSARTAVEDSLSQMEDIADDRYKLSVDNVNFEGYGSSDDLEEIEKLGYKGVPDFASIFSIGGGKYKKPFDTAKELAYGDYTAKYARNIYARKLIEEGKLPDDPSVATVDQLFQTYRDLEYIKSQDIFVPNAYGDLNRSIEEMLGMFRGAVSTSPSFKEKGLEFVTSRGDKLGVDRPTDVERLPWDSSAFEGIPSLVGAIESSRASKGKVFRAAVDGGDIEDLTVDVVTGPTTPKGKKISTRYSFKLTSWASRKFDSSFDLGDTRGFTKEDKIEIPTLKTDENGTVSLSKKAFSVKSKKGVHGTYVFDSKIDGVPVKIRLARADAKGRTEGKAFDSVASIIVPEGTDPSIVQKAMELLGVQDARPATPVDSRIWIENRIISVFGGMTDATSNPDDPNLRKGILDAVKEKFGFTPDDVKVVKGSDNRIEMRIPDEAAKKIQQVTGVKHFRHSLYTHNDKRVQQAPWQERDGVVASVIADMFTKDKGTEGTLLSTTNRYYRGMKSVIGMSQSDDVRTGGADYIFTSPSDETWAIENGGSFRFIYDAEKMFRRIDFYTNSYDNYGYRAETADVIDTTKHGAHETIFKGGIGPEALLYIIVESKGKKQKLVDALRSRGVTQINGRDVDDIVTYGIVKEAQDAALEAKNKEEGQNG